MSVASRCSIETPERIVLVFFARKFPLTYHTLWCKEIQVSSLELCSKFRHRIWIVERAINLARDRWTLRA